MKVWSSLVACAAAGALFVIPHVAHSETEVTYADAGRNVFEVTVPDFWTLRVGGEREITPPSEDALRPVARVFGLSPESANGVWVGLMSPPQLRSLKDARDYAKSLSGQLAKTTEIVRTEERTVAGYPAFVIDGKGRRNGRSVNFTAAVLELPRNRVVVGLTVLERGYDPDALSDVNAILQSIQAR
ncbi:hypothetical protein [Shimia sp. MMG029]|uniref:hypothetical protein n=1 Tax=Shimia sp. MMG029 TaxID=3021978 RepID=UPI0022FE623D|nr:hypothetical protein [Shimia sp. MMG029]MDA5555566.1 hypothetical protein [Shimia sp. MMG029]